MSGKNNFPSWLWDLTIQYGENESLHKLTEATLSKKEMPEVFSHEDVVALMDLDNTLGMTAIDNLIDDLDTSITPATWLQINIHIR